MTARKTAAKVPTARKPAEDKDLAQEKRRMRTILRRLHKEYPDSQCSLHFKKPLQLVLATILSAQCTDERVNMVTPSLFKKYPTARRLADAELPEVEELIRSTGFYRNKAKSLVGCAQRLVLEHKGEVPSTLKELVALPGVGRKTANVVLGNAFGIPGLVVDTHVMRISRLLELTDEKDPNKIEQALMQVTPRTEWSDVAHLFIDHGRKVCIARRPQCDACVLNNLCPASLV
jgi:endonuclease-3